MKMLGLKIWKIRYLLSGVAGSDWRVAWWGRVAIFGKRHSNKMIKFLLIVYFHGTKNFLSIFLLLNSASNIYYTILYYTIPYLLYYTILYYTILYYTILYYTILCYTIYYTILTISRKSFFISHFELKKQMAIWVHVIRFSFFVFKLKIK